MMEMNDFQQQMREKLIEIGKRALCAAHYCSDEEFEGCVLYEQLLDVEQHIIAAVEFYVEDVPACSREDIVRMNEKAHGRIPPGGQKEEA